MTAQQIQIKTKLEKDEIFSSYKTIDAKVSLLIAKLNKLQNNYYKSAYMILNAILKLRQRQIKKYGIPSLAREKGIELSVGQITYIFGYRFISEYTKKQIETGKLKETTALYIIRQGNVYRNPTYQDKIVKKYLDKEINISQIGFMSVNNVLDSVVNDKEIEKGDKSSVRILENLKQLYSELEKKKDIFKDRNVINQIRLCSERINEECENILKFGKNIDKKPIVQNKSNTKYDFLDEENEN